MVKFLTVEIYNITVVFFSNPTKAEFETMYHDNVTRITDKEYKQMYYDIFENEKCGGFTFLLECGDIICFVKFPEKRGYIAHEILHTTNRILGTRGIIADYDNDEAQAYLLAYLTERYYEFFGDK
jgi:hypothetical protein